LTTFRAEATLKYCQRGSNVTGRLSVRYLEDTGTGMDVTPGDMGEGGDVKGQAESNMEPQGGTD
jgi:hypothetical protein